MRLPALALALAACGGSPKPAPATSTAPAPAPAASTAFAASTAPVAPTDAADDPPVDVIGNDDSPPLPAPVAAIGTVGTISHGANPPAPPPTATQVSIGAPSAGGGLDPVIIRRFLRRDSAKFVACYEQAATRPATGTLSAAFTIDPEGTVIDASATGLNAEIATCVAGVVRAIGFPKPDGGGKVVVRYPMVFKPR